MNKDEHMLKVLMKENEELKKLLRDKISSNDTLNSLVALLEIQRERINNLEEENAELSQINEKLKDKLKESEMRLANKSFYKDNPMSSFSSFSEINNIKTVRPSQETTHYMKRCKELEETIQELKLNYTKALIKVKADVINESINDLRRINSRQENDNDLSMRTSNASVASSHKKKNLTPISSKSVQHYS